jgi:hypothetical protein
MDSLTTILKSNNIEAEERNIARLKATIENLNQELCVKELKLEKLKRKTMNPTIDTSMQITEEALQMA